ncbi:MAG: hypothetical protein J0I41_14395 [Filimonas sp.]|nr:hypothetical protein [Filimonas sp.]
MIKKFFKPLLIASASLTAIYGIVWACAGGWDEEYGNSGFTPEAFVDSAYAPFFYSEDWAYYNIRYDQAHDTRFSKSNVTEWRSYFSNKVPASELDYLLNTASQGAIDSGAAYTSGRIKKLSPAIASYTLFQQKEAGEFLAYLSLAKQSETFVLIEDDVWSGDKKKAVNAKAVDALTTKLQSALDKQQNTFIKQRIWFQLVRAKYFRSAWKESIAIFDKYKAVFPANEVYYRTLAYAAGDYYKQGNYAQANYYYSLVFKSSDALKVVAHWSFHPQEEKDWNATLALCKNNDERTTLWEMLGLFYHDEMRSIKEIYKLEPKSEKLNLLLVRVVNKTEQRFNFHNENYYQDGNGFVDKDSAAMINTKEIGAIADAGNTDKPYLWHLAYGYMNFLSNKMDVANKYISKAEKNLPKQKLAEAQVRLLKLAVKVGSVKTINNSFEKNVLEDFSWLKNFNDSTAEAFRHADLWNWVRNRMAQKYQSQKEWVKAECYVHGSDFFVDNNKVEELKALKTKSNATPYEQFFVSLSAYNMSDLLEYQAIRDAYNNKIDDAIAKMKQVNAPTQLLGNPFNGFIKDCHDCDHAAPQKVKYNKLTFLQKMKEMQDKITAGQDVYGNARLLGNAFYNMSHYGNARYFYESKIIGSGDYSPLAIDSVFRATLTDMHWAKYYYNLALQNAQTNELKAQCQYLQAKCERNDWFTKNIFSNRDNEWNIPDALPDASAMSSFKILKDQYSNTAYYNELIRECGWFDTYVTRKKK